MEGPEETVQKSKRIPPKSPVPFKKGQVANPWGRAGKPESPEQEATRREMEENVRLTLLMTNRASQDAAKALWDIVQGKRGAKASDQVRAAEAILARALPPPVQRVEVEHEVILVGADMLPPGYAQRVVDGDTVATLDLPDQPAKAPTE